MRYVGSPCVWRAGRLEDANVPSCETAMMTLAASIQQANIDYIA
jgi:hypothetical protein